MADLLCKRCGEPWEMDFIYDLTEVSMPDRKRFLAGKGCPGCYNDADPININPEGSEVMAAFQDVLGDDMDGIAAELEDLGFV